MISQLQRAKAVKVQLHLTLKDFLLGLEQLLINTGLFKQAGSQRYSRISSLIHELLFVLFILETTPQNSHHPVTG